MMIGHAALAFALAAWAAVTVGVSRERALLFGVVAGAFATVPDVDMGYALVGLASAVTSGSATFPEVFWETGNVVHRGLTHSLVVGGFAAVLFGLVAYRGRPRRLAVAGLAGAVLVTLARLGALEAGVLALFALAGTLVAVGARRVGLAPGAVLAAALVGVLSHPFGDLFTGTTPTLLAPFDVRLLPDRVLLSSDPTLQLLGSFALELATVWLAVVVYLGLRDRRAREYVHRRAVLGAGYAGIALALPAPTLAVSYHFVFSLLAVGLVGVSIDFPVPDIQSRETRWTIVVTGLAAVTLGLLAYTASYLVVG